MRILSAAFLILVVPSKLLAQDPRSSAGRVDTIASIAGQVGAVASTRDGKRIYYSTADTLWMYDVSARRTRRIASLPGIAPGQAPAWGGLAVSPNADRVAFTRAEDTRAPLRQLTAWSLPINPKDGMASGAAMRVTLRTGLASDLSFSPDGLWLAFRILDPAGGGRSSIAIVPSAGGPDRVVLPTEPARGVFNLFGWSADQKWIYFAWTGPGPGVQRVSVETGVVRVVVPSGVPMPPGKISPDGGALLATTPWPDPAPSTARSSSSNAAAADEVFVVPGISFPSRFNLVDTSGRFIATIPDGDWRATLLGAGRQDWNSPNELRVVIAERKYGVQLVSRSDGTVRSLLPERYEIQGVPEWSPDGSRIVAIARRATPKGAGVVIVTVPGNRIRAISIPGIAHSLRQGTSNGFAPKVVWSPDGRHIALSARGDNNPVLASDGLIVVDVETGAVRRLKTMSGAVGDFRWNKDSRSIRYVHATLGKSAERPIDEIAWAGPRPWFGEDWDDVSGLRLGGHQVREIDFNGRDTPVAPIPVMVGTSLPQLVGERGGFLSDNTMLLITGGTGHRTRAYDLAARTFIEIHRERFQGGAGVSPDGQLIAMLPQNRNGRPDSNIVVLSSAGSIVGNISLRSATSVRFDITSDNRSVIVYGPAERGGCCSLFEAETRGGPLRKFADLPAPALGVPASREIAVSPDGKFVVVTEPGASQTQFIAIDISDIRQPERR